MTQTMGESLSPSLGGDELSRRSIRISSIDDVSVVCVNEAVESRLLSLADGLPDLLSAGRGPFLLYGGATAAAASVNIGQHGAREVRHVAKERAINVELGVRWSTDSTAPRNSRATHESELAVLEALVDRGRGVRKGSVGTKESDDANVLQPSSSEGVGDELRGGRASASSSVSAE